MNSSVGRLRTVRSWSEGLSLQSSDCKEVHDCNGKEYIHLPNQHDNPLWLFQFSKLAEAVNLVNPKQHNPKHDQKHNDRNIKIAHPSRLKIEEFPNRSAKYDSTEAEIAKMVKDELYSRVISGDLDEGFR